MTVRMTIMVAYVRWRNRSRHDPGNLERSILARNRPAEVPDRVRDRCEVTEETIAGRRVVTLTPPGGGAGVHVIHLHGGAYVYAIQEAHWRALAGLTESSGAVIHVPLYGLAPGSTADEAQDLLDAVYERVAAGPGVRCIVLSGDSAGGGLALAHAIRRRDRALPPSAAVMLYSPWLDAAVPDRVDRRLQLREPMLSVPALRRAGSMWAGSGPVARTMVSPINDGLAGLPPITTFVGGRDILLEDARRLDATVRDAGGRSTLRVWPSGFHVFMAASKTREAREAMAAAAGVLRAL